MNFNVVALNKQVTELDSLINTHLATIAERDNTIVNKDNEISALQKTIEGFPHLEDTHKAEIATLNESHANAVAELKANHEKVMKDLQDQLEATRMSANKEAHKIVASLGIPEAEVKVPTEDNNSKTPEQLAAEFHGMKPGVERTAFWNKHKEAILSTFRKK